jgi:multiple sugar transport system substrate-binding protein
VKNQFASGNVAMMVNGPWQIPPLRTEAPNLNWDVVLIPRDAKFASVLGGENWAVINNENTASSLEFIKWVTSPDAVRSYIDRFGYIAARKDVAAGQFSGDVVMKKFTDELQYALPRGPHARWPEISDAISLAFNEVITKRGTPAQAAAKAQATIDGIVK